MTNIKLSMTFTILTLARCHNDEDDVTIIYQITWTHKDLEAVNGW